MSAAALMIRGCDCEIRTATHRGISERELLEFRPHLVVLGAGSLLTLHYLQPLALAQKHGIPTATWGTGFDKLPARHLDELLRGAPRLTVWRDDDSAQAFRRTLDACRWVGVRGPHTLRILEAGGCAPPALHVCGDPGLLLRPTGAPEPVPPFLQAWVGAKAPIVGVNWGTANNNVFGGDERAVEQALRHVIERLLRRSYKVLLFSVWGPDLSAMRRLAAHFEGDPNVGALQRVPTGSSLARIVERCRFTINFKLHANVFTAAAGRPFISLAYRSKCYDFAASLGCDDLVVRFDQPDLPDAVLSLCDLIERERKRIVKRIDVQRRRYIKRIKALVKQIAALAPGEEES